MNKCLIVFAKEPVLGKVKTRLELYFTRTYCLNLYKAFLRDTLNVARKVKCNMRILAYSSPVGAHTFLKRNSRSFLLYKQRGSNLGMRMHDAFTFARKLFAEKIIIIGSDAPTVTPALIHKAFARLTHNDVVIGPSYDGGYYLIGVKQPSYSIFKGIAWSSNTVCTQTLAQCKKNKKKVSLLAYLFDVDTPEALNKVKSRLQRSNKNIAPYSRTFLCKKQVYV